MSDAPAAADFKFELVSPEKILVSEQVMMVTVPGEEGDFGVLALHAPLLSALRPGVLTVTQDNGDRRIFVSGGFADVSPTQLSVLAEEAVNVTDINRAEVEERLKTLEDDIGFAKDDPVKYALLAKQIEVAKAKLQASA